MSYCQNFNQANPFYETRALQRAIQSGDCRKSCLFLKLGCSPNVKCGSQGMTPLIACCYQKDMKKCSDVAAILIDYGGDPAQIDVNGNNLLHHACMLGLRDIVCILADSMDSSLYCAQNKMGDTPLHICAAKGEAQILQIIVHKAIQHGENLSICNADGFTPLAIAYNHNENDCARLLHDRGAMPRCNKRDLDLPKDQTDQIVQESILVSTKAKSLKSQHTCQSVLFDGNWSAISQSNSDTQQPNHDNCCADIIKSLTGSRFYHAKESVAYVGHGSMHQEPITQGWIDNVHGYKPSTFANIASFVVRSKSRAQKTATPQVHKSLD